MAKRTLFKITAVMIIAEAIMPMAQNQSLDLFISKNSGVCQDIIGFFIKLIISEKAVLNIIYWKWPEDPVPSNKVFPMSPAQYLAEVIRGNGLSRGWDGWQTLFQQERASDRVFFLVHSYFVETNYYRMNWQFEFGQCVTGFFHFFNQKFLLGEFFKFKRFVSPAVKMEHGDYYFWFV